MNVAVAPTKRAPCGESHKPHAHTPFMTFSSSFQMVSLLHLAEITEEGVTFQSPVDGSRMLLTPEESIQIQNRLGADIIMALDDVVPATMQVGCLGVERCGGRNAAHSAYLEGVPGGTDCCTDMET